MILPEDEAQVLFKEEAYERLEELEKALLKLEQAPEDAELVASVFRVFHTIKGTGAMFGFHAISAFTHQVETVFEKVRKGHLKVNRQLLDLTLAAHDRIAAMLEGQDEASLSEALVLAFQEFGAGKASIGPPAPSPTAKASAPLPSFAPLAFVTLDLGQNLTLSTLNDWHLQVLKALREAPGVILNFPQVAEVDLAFLQWLYALWCETQKLQKSLTLQGQWQNSLFQTIERAGYEHAFGWLLEVPAQASASS